MFLTTKFDIAFVILSAEITNTQVKALECFQDPSFNEKPEKNHRYDLKTPFNLKLRLFMLSFPYNLNFYSKLSIFTQNYQFLLKTIWFTQNYQLLKNIVVSLVGFSPDFRYCIDFRRIKSSL